VVQNNIIKNLLVVEDERVISNICQRVMSKQGFNVVLAADGNIAINLLNKQQFDVCLLDIRIPGIDGIELYRYICRSFPNLSFRVIFMTGDALTGNIPEFVHSAGCQLLEKPFTTDELLTAVKNVEGG
jgi:DNA-binding response OmpR family regulator